MPDGEDDAEEGAGPRPLEEEEEATDDDDDGDDRASNTRRAVQRSSSIIFLEGRSVMVDLCLFSFSLSLPPPHFFFWLVTFAAGLEMGPESVCVCVGGWWGIKC